MPSGKRMNPVSDREIAHIEDAIARIGQQKVHAAAVQKRVDCIEISFYVIGDTELRSLALPHHPYRVSNWLDAGEFLDPLFSDTPENVHRLSDLSGFDFLLHHRYAANRWKLR